MWKPYIPFYLPCRQATSAEQKELAEFLDKQIPMKNGMMKEAVGHEAFGQVNESIIVVFDWKYYQTSSLVPVQEDTQYFPKIMCVFWDANPNNIDLFSWDKGWENGGTLQRMRRQYDIQDQIRKTVVAAF